MEVVVLGGAGVIGSFAVDWLNKTQLPNGYWSYHYLDDGTSMAVIGAVASLKALAGKN